MKIAFVGPPVTVRRKSRCAIARRSTSSAANSTTRSPITPRASRWKRLPGASFPKDGEIVHNPEAPQLDNLDELPWVTKVYKRDLDFTSYNVPFLLNPYISFYTTRGCPAQCTFCLWPQTLCGHPLAPALGRRRGARKWRTR